MTLYKETITLTYLLTKLLKNAKVTAEHINDIEVSTWLSAWNNVKSLREALYTVAEEIDNDHHKGGGDSFNRLSDMTDMLFVATEGHHYQEAVVELIDLMLVPERINETVMYIIHGDI